MVAIGMPGMWEWLVILAIVLIFFGAGKLPEVFAQAGKGLKAFKDASEGRDAAEKKPRAQLEKDEDELDDAPAEKAAVRREKE